MKLPLVGAFVVAASFCPMAAFAQGNHPTSPALRITDRIARSHFELGNDYFQIARYDDAVREFQAALDLSHQPELLFNIGRALEGAGRTAEALDAYRRFDEAGAPGFDRELLHARMESLRARVAASPSPEPVASSAPPPASVAPEPVAPPPAPVQVRYTYHRGIVPTVGPFVLMGLGLVAGAFAVVEAVGWSGDSGTISNVNNGSTPWGSGPQAAYGNAGTEGMLAWILGGAGVALIGTGAVWLAVRGPGDREVVREPHAWLVPTPGGAMVGVGGAL